ncbi:unnamed protein product [Chondrus crispus]|uniref:Uncharacterized protein n=1 Tax=Chondrus crispus TaxID=2769 RepID=R7QN68_CHOCR|nr:unnamed protein product [Chondrus crispus]CDF39228.1 unnamed protein product [Chondrus crispus]|eukprot:XP_005719139.1 unnamed protein product [Chondrus crispus]
MAKERVEGGKIPAIKKGQGFIDDRNHWSIYKTTDKTRRYSELTGLQGEFARS